MVCRRFILEPGDAYHFPPGLPHQEEAIVLLDLEMSPGLGNDRMGLEKEYGLPNPPDDALEDSTVDEISLKPWYWGG